MEVFMILLTLFKNFPAGEGFGFNTNILETNIINLAVVIAVVVTLLVGLFLYLISLDRKISRLEKK